MAIGDKYECSASFGTCSTKGLTRSISVCVSNLSFSPDEAYDAFCARRLNVHIKAEIPAVSANVLPGQMSLPGVEVPPDVIDFMADADVSSYSVKKSGISFSLSFSRKQVQDGILDQLVKQAGRLSIEVLGDCSDGEGDVEEKQPMPVEPPKKAEKPKKNLNPVAQTKQTMKMNAAYNDGFKAGFDGEDDICLLQGDLQIEWQKGFDDGRLKRQSDDKVSGTIFE